MPFGMQEREAFGTQGKQGHISIVGNRNKICYIWTKVERVSGQDQLNTFCLKMMSACDS